MSNKSNDITVQPKNSFNRFGDDLTELILNYLSIGDKLRFQCLSQQIGSTILNKVYDLRVQYDKYCDKFLVWTASDRLDAYLGYQDMDQVLQKLVNLSKVSIYGFVDPKQHLMTAIADNCPNLKSLILNNNYSEIDLSVDQFLHLGRKSGQNILSLKVNQYYPKEHIRQLLAFTPNLKSIEVTNLSTILNEANVWNQTRKTFLPNLKKVVFEYCDTSDLDQFVAEYGHSVVDLQTSCDASDLIARLHCFPRLERLKVAAITGLVPQNNICDGLMKMTTNCLRLKKLVMSATNLPPCNMFKVVGQLKNLEYLDIRLYGYQTRDQHDQDNVLAFGSVRDFGRLSRLKCFTFFMDHLNDQNLKDIDRYLPNLVSIRFYSESYITDKTLESLSNIKALQKVHIVCDSQPSVNTITDRGVKRLLANCRHLRELELYSCRYIDGDHKYRYKKFDITKASVEAFIKRAKQRPTVELKLLTNWDRDWSRVNHMKNSIQLPHNLSLGFH